MATEITKDRTGGLATWGDTDWEHRMSLWENKVICFPLSLDLRVTEIEGILGTSARPGSESALQFGALCLRP